MKRLFLILLVACAGFAAAPHRAAADTCGVPEKGTIWVDFADGSVPFWQTFARPGVIAAAANFIYPPQLRALGAKTVYFDLNFRLRVGTPLEPYDPGVVINRANRLYSTAAMSSGCTQPVIAENEMNGANLVTPWTANNAAVPAKRPDLHADALGPRRAPGAARPERAVHGRRGGRLVAAALAVRRGRARDVLRRARHRQAGADRGQPVAAQPVPQARRRVHLRRPAGEQGRADARLPDDAGLRRPRAGAAQLVARGDEAAGPRRQAGRERGRPALDLVVGLGRLERRRARPGQAGRGLRLPLGPRPEPLQRPGRGGQRASTRR